MRPNYTPWQARPEEFPEAARPEEQLRFLLRFAVLAPSSHNSQPWAFRVRPDAIDVRVDSSRRLAESDRNDRQLFVSMGCAIANLFVAADYCGYAVKVAYLPNRGDFDPVVGGVNPAATISFGKRGARRSDPDHLIFSIPQRLTNRSPYEDRLPDHRFLDLVRGFAAPDMEIALITDRAQRMAVSDVVLAAGIAAMDDAGFRRELSEYVKPNTTWEKVGMPAFGMGIPTLPSLIAPALIRRVNMNRLNRKKDERLLKEGTPLFVVISTRGDDSISWMRAGEAYERIALEATRAGISTNVMAAAIQIGEHYRDLQKVLGTTFRPQVFFRLGYAPTAPPHSPRLSAEEVLTPIMP